MNNSILILANKILSDRSHMAGSEYVKLNSERRREGYSMQAQKIKELVHPALSETNEQIVQDGWKMKKELRDAKFSQINCSIYFTLLCNCSRMFSFLFTMQSLTVWQNACPRKFIYLNERVPE